MLTTILDIKVKNKLKKKWLYFIKLFIFINILGYLLVGLAIYTSVILGFKLLFAVINHFNFYIIDTIRYCKNCHSKRYKEMSKEFDVSMQEWDDRIVNPG